MDWLGMSFSVRQPIPDTLKDMKKGFNMMKGGAVTALENFRRHGIRIYGTFIFGYDHDRPETFDRSVEFAIDQGLAIGAFNHITPFQYFRDDLILDWGRGCDIRNNL